ncbi:MAG: hypothetical protein ACKVVP_24895 [Chloroflexota bacterium]
MTFTIPLNPVLFWLGPFQIGWHGLFSALVLWARIRLGTAQTARRWIRGADVSRGRGRRRGGRVALSHS